MLAMLLIGLHRIASRNDDRPGRPATVSIDLTMVAAYVAEATTLEPADDDASIHRILDAAGYTLGWVAKTSPVSDRIVGYAGPTDSLILTDESGQVTSVELLHSPDTTEHLRKVLSDRRFWQQFVGWRWGETANVRVDGVSGATLTSLAIAEAVAWRLSGDAIGESVAGPPPRRSLRFSDDPDPDRLRRWFADADRLRPHEDESFRVAVKDSAGDVIAEVIRTGPLADSVIGYQGPSEVWLRLKPLADDAAAVPLESREVADLMLGNSFDNQPYVDYVKQEYSFWPRFRDRTLGSLAELDLDAEEIDGVSGATMTSLAVAETIRAASASWLEYDRQRQQAILAAERSIGSGPRSLRIHASATEWITAILAVGAIIWSRNHRRGHRWPRLLWQLTVFLLIGLVCGNLLSVALFAGWTGGGVPWRLAPGLLTLVIVSLLTPAITKRNVYCDHLCPHGIAQQWLRPRRRRRLWRWLPTLLRISGCGILALAAVSLITKTPVPLAWFEPFDSYVLRVGWGASLIVWTLSLILGRFDPMAYCRYACPTGMTLAYVRHDASRHALKAIDVCFGIATIAIWLFVLTA